MSHFFSGFKLLSKEEQDVMLVNIGIWDEFDDIAYTYPCNIKV